MKEVKKILKKIKRIHSKHEKKLNSFDYKFNVFSILRKETDEVGLHSRFIYELLNPNSSHNRGDAFLKLFLEEIKINMPENEYISVEREYKEIDLLIRSKSQAIIIENKIWAADQDKQLERYQKEINKEGVKKIDIIYLTLNGDKPSENSKGKIPLEKIKLLSYKVNINNWLRKCLNKIELTPGIKEVITQYQRVVQKITETSEINEYIMEIKDLLLKDKEKIKLANDISKAFLEVKIDIQYKFWKSLEESIKKDKNFEINEVCDEENVKRFYYNKTKNKDYGITIKINDTLAKEGFNFCIKVYNNIYFGFEITNNGKFEESKIKIFEKLGFKPWDNYLYFKIQENSPDFDKFDIDEILEFIHDEKLKEYTNNLAADAKSVINEFIDEY